MDIDGTAREMDLTAESNDYFSGLSEEAGVGTLYRFQLDGDHALYPDPVSRFQPEGPSGRSRVVDPTAFAWRDAGWPGAAIRGQVIYEMHLGTFTPERGWAAAMRELPELERLGITCLEIMPIAEFAGEFGWGYDGVDLFAPSHLYGEPDDVRRFVDEAHSHGLAVILDVVYNHLGPDGNYLAQFSPTYFTDRYHTDWGEALNFDGPESGPVREFFLANARAWIEEYHFDGLRLDATQSIFDESPEHLLAAIAREVRTAARGRATSSWPRTNPRRRGWPDHGSAAATDSTGYGTTICTTAWWSRSRERARPTTPTTAARPRSSSRRRSGGSCTRDSATSGSGAAAALPRSTCRQRRS